MTLITQLTGWLKNLSEAWQTTLFATLFRTIVTVTIAFVTLTVTVLLFFFGRAQPKPDAPTSTQDPQNLAFAAERVRTCMETHNLFKQRDVTEEILYTSDTILELEPGDLVTRKTIEYCQWPPSSYSEADGYVQIVSEEVIGPGLSEATFSSYADRIFSNCQTLKLSYGFGK